MPLLQVDSYINKENKSEEDKDNKGNNSTAVLKWFLQRDTEGIVGEVRCDRVVITRGIP